jgi:preprotein translocase SecE subunit
MLISVYKRSQGKYTRLCSAAGAAIIIGLGCSRLYEVLRAAEFGLSARYALLVATLVPVAVFIILGALALLLVNRPSIADFMISAEGEMKKVNWSTRKEITVSTVVVIAVVIAMGVLFWITDLTFRAFFVWLIGY